MNLEEITLEDIRNYFKENGTFEELTLDSDEKPRDGYVDLYRFDGELDEWILVGSISEDKDFYGGFRVSIGDDDSYSGIPEDVFEDDENVSIEEVIAQLISSIKGMIVEEIDFFESQKRAIDRFCNKKDLENPGWILSNEHEYLN